MPPRPARAAATLACLAVAACSAPERPDVVWSDPFCAEAMPRVDAWLDSVSAALPGPDDDRYGGTLVAAGGSELSAGGGMNAFVGADYVTRQHQQYVGLMTLVRYDDTLEPAPYLAESWELNDDGTEVTFHLRRDVRWHDGQVTDAHDVAFTYERITDPALGYVNASFFDTWVRGVEGVEVVDDFTVRMRLTPHSEYLDPWTAVGIMPEHLLGDVPVAALAEHPFGSLCPVGNGPFVFREHVTDQRWTFAANPAWPEGLGGRPFVDRYVYRTIPEQATLLTELLTGGIDFYVQPRPEQVERIEASPDARVVSFPGRLYTFVAWNLRTPVLADARVRRALAMGWNRRDFVEANLRGFGSVANGPVPPSHWAFDPATGEALAYDPDEAARLLTEAGWVDRDGDGVRENTDGLPLSFELNYNTGNLIRQNAAEYMQSQLAPLGVEVRAAAADYAELIGRIQEPDADDRDFDAVILAWTVEFRLDDTSLFHSRSRAEPNGFAGLQDPEVDRLLDAINAAATRAEAMPYWRAYQEAIVELVPYQFLYYPDRIMGLRNRVHDVRADLRGEWSGLTDWWIDPAAR